MWDYGDRTSHCDFIFGILDMAISQLSDANIKPDVDIICWFWSMTGKQGNRVV